MLISVNSGKAIDIYDGVYTNGARIQQYDPWSGPMQLWAMDMASDGNVVLRNPASNMVLDVTDMSVDDGAIVQLYSATGGANQRWKPIVNADGSYTFVNVNSGKCLDLLGSSLDDGAPVGQWDCDGKLNQNWSFVAAAQDANQAQSPNTTTSSNGNTTGAGNSNGTTGTGATCGDGVCAATESYLSCSQDCQHRVGVFYSGWHWGACSALNQLQQQGQPVITIEDLLESRLEDGSASGTGLNFDQLLINPGLTGLAANFYYQHLPAGGQYCIVHQRQPGDINYNASHEGMAGSYAAPDCPNWQATVTRQAQQMVAAGIDFVVVDGTNIAGYDAGADAIQLRPFEVLVQQFTALRAQGIATPEVAMWQRFPENPTTAGDTGDWSYRHVLAVYNEADYQQVLMHDAKTGKMVYFYPDLYNFDPGFVDVINSNGGANNVIAVPMWAYAQTPNQWSFMSSCQAGGHIDDSDCNQPWTPTSVLGSQMAVVPTYQTGVASLPWQGAGLLGGVTLRKQFATAFAQQPDYLLLSSWNETIAQPGTSGPSMGLETDSTAQNASFVDNFGTEFSRDIEPSEELGTFVYDLVSSCLRIYRSGSTSCNQSGEACCQGGNFSDNFTRFDGANGTFVVHANADTGLSPLYNCQAGNFSFFSKYANCEGQTVIGLVGYVADKRGGATLRSLYRCVQPGTANHGYSVNTVCPSGMQVESVLGYVR